MGLQKHDKKERIKQKYNKKLCEDATQTANTTVCVYLSTNHIVNLKRCSLWQRSK